MVSRFRKIAIVIPAYNEELSIEKTVVSVLAMKYPRKYFDVIVVADNCNDRTAELARGAGAIVFERKHDALRGKGYALRWCFDLLLTDKSGYDGVAVVDADSIVSDNFLDVMNFYLECGAQAIQCCDLVQPQPSSWSSEITRIGFTLYNYVRPLGRRVIGCSVGIRGNGMCFSAHTLRVIPWQAYSLAEDCEYGLELLLRNIHIEFASEATVFAAMPQQAGNAETQRARWEQGRFQLVRRYSFRLLWAAVRRTSFKTVDTFIDLVTPPFVNLVAITMVMMCLSFVLWAINVQETFRFVLLWMVLLGVAVVHVLVGLYVAKADRLLYKALLNIPRYAIWKLMLWIKLIRHGQSHEWIRTTREHSQIRDVVNEHSKQ